VSSYTIASYTPSLKQAKSYLSTSDMGDNKDRVILSSRFPSHQVYTGPTNPVYISALRNEEEGRRNYLRSFDEHMVFGRRMKVTSITKGKPPVVTMEPV
jgi:hypothetical protein